MTEWTRGRLYGEGLRIIKKNPQGLIVKAGLQRINGRLERTYEIRGPDNELLASISQELAAFVCSRGVRPGHRVDEALSRLLAFHMEQQ